MIENIVENRKNVNRSTTVAARIHSNWFVLVDGTIIFSFSPFSEQLKDPAFDCLYGFPSILWFSRNSCSPSDLLDSICKVEEWNCGVNNKEKSKSLTLRLKIKWKRTNFIWSHRAKYWPSFPTRSRLMTRGSGRQWGCLDKFITNADIIRENITIWRQPL